MERLNDNLFLPPTDEVLRELPRDREGNPHESVYAAHSSAALVAYVSAYWRLHDNLRPIISAPCSGLVGHVAEGLTFEAQCPIGRASPQPDRKPPHLDVVITCRDKTGPSAIKGIGVESKFGELYGQDQGPFADCYVAPENICIWDGREPLSELAVRIDRGEKRIYRRLKVAQPIEHALGLRARFHGATNLDLIYLWYPAPGGEAVEHEGEIRRFQQATDACQPRIRFRAITYPDLIHPLSQTHGDVHGAYVDYPAERYS